MSEKEIWKTVNGFNGDYQISNLGNLIMFYHGEWQPKASYVTKAGYLHTTLQRDGIKRRCGIHQLVAECFVDGWFEGAEVNHKDLNKLNNRWDNLEWVTRNENQIHQYLIYHPEYKPPMCPKCGNLMSSNRSKLCKDCRRKEKRKNWPSKEELIELLKHYNFTETGRKLGCTDNAVKKICRAYNLPDKTNLLKQFRKDGGCYIPTKTELKRSLKERYVYYEVNGISETATGWSRILGLEHKRIKRYANKHTYEETIQYIKSFMN